MPVMTVKPTARKPTPPCYVCYGLLLALAVLGLMLTGCAGLSDREQREVSGAAIGGVVAGPLGAGLGALIGLLVDASSEKASDAEDSR